MANLRLNLIWIMVLMLLFGNVMARMGEFRAISSGAMGHNEVPCGPKHKTNCKPHKGHKYTRPCNKIEKCEKNLDPPAPELLGDEDFDDTYKYSLSATGKSDAKPAYSVKY